MKEEKYLFSLQNRGIKLGLQRTEKLLEYCNNPLKKIQIILANNLCEYSHQKIYLNSLICIF